MPPLYVIRLALIALFLLAHRPAVAGQTTVAATLESYDREVTSGKGPSKEERNDYCQTWIKRFLQSVANDPKSPRVGEALKKALGLADTLEDYQQSYSIVQALLATDPSPEFQLTWTLELGEIKMQDYRKSANKKALAEAARAFEKANALGKTITARNENISEQTRIKYVLSLAFLARLESEENKNFKTSASLFRTARDQISRLGPSGTQMLQEIGFGAENLLSAEIADAAKDGDEKTALACLDDLLREAKGHKLQSPPSYLTYTFATTQYPDDREAFSKFVSRWIAEHDEDEWTPFLMFYLAENLVKTEQFAKALPILLKLKNDYSARLLVEDKEAIKEKQAAGYYYNVLNQLAYVYQKLGHDDKIRALAEEALSLGINDEILNEMAGGRAPLAPEKSRWELYFYSIGGVVLVIVVGFLLYRKRQHYRAV